MRIHGLTVCVNYADLLAKGMENWKRGLDDLRVVTTPSDEATLRLCDRWGVEAYTTNVFYGNGATFNKGAAIAEAFEAFEWPDWCAFIDSDIIPPIDWRSEVEMHNPIPGNLYGARRRLENGWEIPDGELAGWFQLFHGQDLHALVRPIVDTHWKHAGCYDSYFAGRWPIESRIILPIKMIHQGTPGANWCGRGNDAAMQDLLIERRVRGGHQHERISRTENA